MYVEAVCFDAWKDHCRLKKFHKVCVIAFRERELVRSTKAILQEWHAYTKHRSSEAFRQARSSSRRRERKDLAEREEETSAFTAELNKLKLQAAWNFFVQRFLRQVLKAWQVVAYEGIGKQRRARLEEEKERKARLAARKFCRLMLIHKAFAAWKQVFKARTKMNRLHTDKEYRTLKMQQVLIRKKKELSKNKENVLGQPAQAHTREKTPITERNKDGQGDPSPVWHPNQKEVRVPNRKRITSFEVATTFMEEREGEEKEKEGGKMLARGGIPTNSPTTSQCESPRSCKRDKYQSEELQLSLKKLAARRSGREKERQNHTTPIRERQSEKSKTETSQSNRTHTRTCTPRQPSNSSETTAGGKSGGDIQRNLEERARERIMRREELRRRYEEKLSEESEESRQIEDQTRSYDKRIRELQKIEAKERIYRLELEESERVSKHELRQQQLFLAKMHYRQRLLRDVGFKGFGGLLDRIRAKKAAACSKHHKHLFAVAVQAWKLYMMPFWRRKVLFQVHFHGILSRFLRRFRLERVFHSWLNFVNAKKFKRNRIACYHFGFFKDLLRRREVQVSRAKDFNKKHVMKVHLEMWRDYTSVRAELILLHELEMAHVFRQEYQKGMLKRVFDDWQFVIKDLKRERSIETGKRQTWSKINQWLEELDKEKAEKRELANRVNSQQTSLFDYLSKKDYKVPFSFESKLDYSSIR